MGKKEEKYSSIEIIQGIRKHDRKVLDFVYKAYFPHVCKYVEERHGNKGDAWDVFQDAMGVVFDLVKREKNNFLQESSFKTFFIGICHNIWLKQLRNRKLNLIFNTAMVESMPEDDREIQSLIRSNILFRICQKHIAMLKPDCRMVIEMTANEEDGEKLAEMLHFESVQAAYNKRRTCIRKLLDLIKNDPEYKNLTDYEKF
jgi:RNA polymerase sigma factor (sigma-70 family)